jgi:hypothetical protein
MAEASSQVKGRFAEALSLALHPKWCKLKETLQEVSPPTGCSEVN